MNVKTKAELRFLLESYGINPKTWNTGKTLGHLFKEIKDGETNLEEDENKNLIRKVSCVSADIIYVEQKTGRIFQLIEEKQIFAGGMIRRRKLKNSLAEKIKLGESIEQAIQRGLREELGIKGNLEIKFQETRKETEMSRSYPGLMAEYTLHIFTVTLHKDQYQAEGYTESRSGIETYFIWK